MKKILLLGSGELGKEFVISAKRLGAHVVACDSYAGAPAMQVADEFRVFSMLDADKLKAAIEEVKPDLIVPEIEAIRTEVLIEAESQGYQVIPSARAANLTMNRDRIRDLAVSLGVGVRIGLEDNIWSNEKREKLTTNKELLHKIHSLASIHEKNIMKPEVLRNLLKI